MTTHAVCILLIFLTVTFCDQQPANQDDCWSLICTQPRPNRMNYSKRVTESTDLLRSSNICTCPSQTFDSSQTFESFDVTCNEFSSESFTIRIDRDYYDILKLVVDGRNRQIPLNFQSKILQCMQFEQLEITNFCPNNSKTSTNVNVTELFQDIKDIRHLKMTHNCIRSITDFDINLKYLRHLDLSFNKLTKIPIFEEPFELQNLDVSNNFISNISRDNFANMTNLKSLNVSMNNLSILPSNLLHELQLLEVLNLSHNSISELPKSLISAKNPNLKQLYLNNNNLVINKSQTYDFRYAEHLIDLDLSHNNIDVKFLNITRLTELETLNMDATNIITLHRDQFSYLKNLKNISFRYNFLTEIPFLRISSNHYIHVDVSHNNITTLHLPVTRERYAPISFDVSYNCIERLDTETKHWMGRPDNINFVCSFCCLTSIHPYTFVSINGEINLSHNNISAFELSGFNVFPNRNQFVSLNLSHNQIESLPTKNDPLWSKILKLDLSHSHMTSIKNLTVTPNMNTLYLNDNLLDDLKDFDVNLSSSNLIDVRLAGNPWKCDCEMINLLQKSAIITDKHLTTCINDGVEYFFSDIDHLCVAQTDNITLLWLLLPFIFILVIVSALTIFYLKFKSEILYFMFSKGICLKFVCEEDIDADKTYDAFVSYSHEDEDWVVDFLLPGLENSTPAYKLCLHNRDWLGGEYIPDQIVKSVQSSRRTIIVLTDHFLKSQWSRMEFDIAYHQATQDGVRRLIVIVPDKVPDLSQVNEEFRTFITLTTYIEATKPHFWRKLRASMPRIETILSSKEKKPTFYNYTFEAAI